MLPQEIAVGQHASLSPFCAHHGIIGRRKGTYNFWVHNIFPKLFRREKNEKCPPIGSPLGRFGRYFVPKKLCFWTTFWAGSGPWGGPKSPQKSPPKVFPDSGRNHQTYYVYVLSCPAGSRSARSTLRSFFHYYYHVFFCPLRGG